MTTSPHAQGAKRTSDVMRDVLLAALPAILIASWFYGPGVLINMVWAGLLALAMEAAILALRGRPVRFYLLDFSALVTAMLMALAIPPYAPWWIMVIGTFFSIVVAKQLYGGLGFNPFNPAMVGYVVLLISFPVQMSSWPLPGDLAGDTPGIIESLAIIFAGASMPDGLTGATALDLMKQNQTLMLEQLYDNEPLFAKGQLAARGSEWINLAFLLGGVWLLYRKIFRWHAPVGMLAALFLLSSFGYDGGSSASHGSPLFHLFSGATMLGAFFIVTDPVSGCTSNRGRLFFGIGVGVLVYVIRVWGNYPDAVAFAVLLLNFAAPFIDYYSQPRTYGHDKRNQVRIKKDS